MATSFDHLLELNDTVIPKGYHPGRFVESKDGATGSWCPDKPLPKQPSDNDIRRAVETTGFDPDEWTIANDRMSISTCAAIGADGTPDPTLRWYKINLVRKTKDFIEEADELLLELIKNRSGKKKKDKSKQKKVKVPYRLLFITDQHLGKSERDGGGSKILTQRWIDGVEEALSDGPFKEVHIAMGGDTVEGYVSQNGKNIATTDMTLQESMRLAQGLLLDTIMKAHAVCEKVSVSVVPGNHGETTRVQGRPMRDSYDIMIVANVQDTIDFHNKNNPDDHINVEFYYPKENRVDVSFTFGKSNITLVHGHTFGSGGQEKGAYDWWTKQIVGGQPSSASHILLAGHFHNWRTFNMSTDRQVVFGAALETYSAWFEHRGNPRTQSGIMKLDIGYQRFYGIGLCPSPPEEKELLGL